MYFTGSFETIGYMVGAPITLVFIAFPVVIVVIVAATIWTKR